MEKADMMNTIASIAIDNALNASKTFFAQPLDKKAMVSKNLGKYYNVFVANGSVAASPTEGR